MENSSVPQEFKDAIMRLLKKEPEERFEDAGSLIEALNDVLRVG